MKECFLFNAACFPADNLNYLNYDFTKLFLVFHLLCVCACVCV